MPKRVPRSYASTIARTRRKTSRSVAKSPASCTSRRTASTNHSGASTLLYAASRPDSATVFGSMPPSTLRASVRTSAAASRRRPVASVRPGSAIAVSRPHSPNHGYPAITERASASSSGPPHDERVGREREPRDPWRIAGAIADKVAPALEQPRVARARAPQRVCAVQRRERRRPRSRPSRRRFVRARTRTSPRADGLRCRRARARARARTRSRGTRRARPRTCRDRRAARSATHRRTAQCARRRRSRATSIVQSPACVAACRSRWFTSACSASLHGRARAHDPVCDVRAVAAVLHPDAPLEQRVAARVRPDRHRPVEAELDQLHEPGRRDRAAAPPVGRERVRDAVVRDLRLERRAQQRAAAGRRARREQQPVIAPRERAGDGTRGEPAEAVGDEPLALLRDRQIAACRAIQPRRQGASIPARLRRATRDRLCRTLPAR